MVTIFNRKELIVTNDPMGLARVKLLLDEANIEYSVNTKANRGVRGRSLEVSTYKGVNLPYSGKEINHTYYLYVRKKDYTRAEEIISTKQ